MSEFTHYHKDIGRMVDSENCGACQLEYAGSEGPNYAGWPLSFLKSGRSIPFKYRHALALELQRTDNLAYVENLKNELDAAGFQWRGLL